MTECEVRPPFGSKVERFANVGYHPRLEVRPGTYKSRKLFPGCYHWDKPKQIVSKVPRWKRQMEIEEFSSRLGFVGEHILRRRKWFNSINGPGWQEVPSLSLNDGIKFLKGERFRVSKAKEYAVPGPGTYGKNHVPYTRSEEKRKSKGFSFSTLASFDQYSKAPRSLTTQRPYHLPPNLYKIKNSMEELLSKTISKRGPYDLFSGERFPDPIVNRVSLFRQRVHPSDLNHPQNLFKGVFLKCGKESLVTARLAYTTISLCRKNPNDPGPSHYDPYPTPVITPSVAPFNSSCLEARPVDKYGYQAPPGRYNPNYKRNIIGDGMKSVFISKVQRSLPQPEKTSWFE